MFEIWRETSRRIEQLDYGDDVLLAKLNCNDNRKFCEEAMSVDRFPTIRAFANGGQDMEAYENNLDADSLLRYVGHAMEATHRAPPRPRLAVHSEERSSGARSDSRCNRRGPSSRARLRTSLLSAARAAAAPPAR